MHRNISLNLNYFIKETEVSGKKLYSIMQTLQGKGGSTNVYDLNLYYSNLEDARQKMFSL